MNLRKMVIIVISFVMLLSLLLIVIWLYGEALHASGPSPTIAINASPPDTPMDQINGTASELIADGEVLDNKSSQYMDVIGHMTELKRVLPRDEQKFSSDLLPLVNNSWILQGQTTYEIKRSMGAQFIPADSTIKDGVANDDMVVVEIALNPTTSAVTIEPYVWDIVKSYHEYGHPVIIARVEIKNLLKLASLDDVQRIHTYISFVAIDPYQVASPIPGFGFN